MINCDVFWWAIECWFVRNMTPAEQVGAVAGACAIALIVAWSYRKFTTSSDQIAA